jgi:hypothetical protein
MDSKLRNFIQEEIKRLHKITLLKEEKRKINEELLQLNEDKWMQKAFSKKEGSLHNALGVPEGKKIPVSKMRQALANPKLKKKAQAAINANPDVYGSLKEEE